LKLTKKTFKYFERRGGEEERGRGGEEERRRVGEDKHELVYK
jgi:hypothetical protein